MTDILDSIDDIDLEDDDLLELLEEDEDDDSLVLDLTDYEMSKTEAEEITEAIRSAATATYVLLARAHAQKAHKALGYDTWADYVQDEFDITASRSYQLLSLNSVIEEIEEAAPEGTEVKLTEAQARDIKRELPKITERIREEAADQDPEEAAETVKKVVEEERREKHKENEEKARKEREKELEEARDQARQEALEEAADQLLEADKPNTMTDSADTEMVEVEVEGDGEGLTLMEVANIQNFIHALDAIAVLPPADEFIKTIPENKREATSEKLLVATAYLNRMQTISEVEWEFDSDN